MHPKFLTTAVLYILASVLLFPGCGNAPKEVRSAGAPPAVPVSVATAVQQSVPVEIHAIGTVEASKVVQVKSQIAGELMSVHFIEGSDIQKGDLLFEIDPRPYQEALRQAEGAVAKDRAQLAQAEANLGRDRAQLKFADADAARYEALLREGVASRAQYDQARANADALKESVRADQAAIDTARAALQSDLAAVDRAKLDLSYCQIRSPISGRAGNLLVHEGNLVQANGDKALVVINQITPIFVSFGVPEEHLSAIRRSSSARQLPVKASPQDNPERNVAGVLTVIDNTVDPATGTIRLKATFDNVERLLWPGQFVSVVLTLDTRRNAVVVPSEAVQAGQQGPFIYVAKPDQTVELRKVAVGISVGKGMVIDKGIVAGETVVTDGQLRLFPGAHIQPVPAGNIDSKGL